MSACKSLLKVQIEAERIQASRKSNDPHDFFDGSETLSFIRITQVSIDGLLDRVTKPKLLGNAGEFVQLHLARQVRRVICLKEEKFNIIYTAFELPHVW